MTSVCSVFSIGKEQDKELLRQAALMLESENKRLVDKNVELTRALLKAQGLDGMALQLRLAQLEGQLAQRNQALFGKSSEKRPQPGATASCATENAEIRTPTIVALAPNAVA